MWVPSILQADNLKNVLITLSLALANSLLGMLLAYRSKITNLLSGFVMSTWWFALSAIPALHTCWQAHMVLLGLILAYLALLKMDFHHEATEEAFLATLICCVVAVVPAVLYAGVILLWGYLIAKTQMTWRVWFASLIAIALRVVLMSILHYMGWAEMIWMENIPHLSWQLWLLFGGISIFTYLSCYFPLQKPSVLGGSLYTVYILLLAICHLLGYTHLLG